MPFNLSTDKFILFIAAIFVTIFSTFYMLSFPPMGYLLLVVWLVAGSVMTFGGFLVFDALRTRMQYSTANTGIVTLLGSFIFLVGFGVIWFVYFVNWD